MVQRVLADVAAATIDNQAALVVSAAVQAALDAFDQAHVLGAWTVSSRYLITARWSSVGSLSKK